MKFLEHQKTLNTKNIKNTKTTKNFKFKKITILTICFVLILSLSSCSFDKFIEEQYGTSTITSEEENQNKIVDEMTVGIDSSDGLNPLTFKKEINFYTIPLIYDSLVKVDSNFIPMPYIAQDINVSGTVCTITLKDNVKFSDGTVLTSSDIEYSIKKLKATTNVYSKKLENIGSVSTKSLNTVILNLNYTDSMFVYNLDFPIFKNNSAEDSMPVGSGRYVYNKNGSEEWLSLNDKNDLSSQIPIKKIILTPLPDNDAVLYSVKSGIIDYSFAKAASTSGYSSATGYSHCKTNNLIFLGTNNSKGFMSEIAIKQAIFCGLKRNQLCSQGFGGFASGTYFPFNPFYSEFIKTGFSVLNYNEETAKTLLENSGYNYSNSSDTKYRYKDGKRLELKLIVNNENSYKVLSARMVKKQLDEMGIYVNIEELTFDNFKINVSNGDFDIYLGEVEIPQNMDLSCFFSNSEIIKNVENYNSVTSSYNNFKTQNGELDIFLNEFYNNPPFIPLMFTRDIVIYSRNMTFNIDPGLSDIYNNMEKWIKDEQSSEQ